MIFAPDLELGSTLDLGARICAGSTSLDLDADLNSAGGNLRLVNNGLDLGLRKQEWSERQDSNLRPHPPQGCALSQTALRSVRKIILLKA